MGNPVSVLALETKDTSYSNVLPDVHSTISLRRWGSLLRICFQMLHLQLIRGQGILVATHSPWLSLRKTRCCPGSTSLTSASWKIPVESFRFSIIYRMERRRPDTDSDQHWSPGRDHGGAWGKAKSSPTG